MTDMPRTLPSPKRHELGFSHFVSENFAFLIGIAFRVTEKSDTLVRFESQRRFVNVFHGRSSYEMGVDIGRWVEVTGERKEQAFPLKHVIGLYLDPDDIGYGKTAATTKPHVSRVSEQLAIWTKEFAWPLLTDGDELFEELSARNADRYAVDRDHLRASLLRSRANEAWRNRDFATVVTSYSEIDLELPNVKLSASERGRLNYATKATAPDS